MKGKYKTKHRSVFAIRGLALILAAVIFITQTVMQNAAQTKKLSEMKKICAV